MPHIARFATLISIGTVAALVLAGCTGGTSDGGGDDSTTLIASHPQEPTTWNYLEEGASSLIVPVYLNVMESLFESNADGSIKPLLAEGYEVSDDGLVYTITLRDAKFHDGSDFDSADVVYSLEKNATSVNPTLAGPLSVVESVEATDAKTVVVTLSRPSNNFVAGLGGPATMIAPEGAFEDGDMGKQLIGTGPFTFGEYRADQDLTLNRFEDYWGEKPFLSKVIHRFMPDETASVNALRAGELDVIGMLFEDGVEQVAGLESDYNVTFNPSTTNSYIFINPTDPVLQDERVRQAIAYAIDREPIIDAAVGGYAEPTCVYVVPYSSPWQTDYCPYPYDPEKSKELLAEAGYPNGLTLYYPYTTIAEFPVSYEVISAQLAEVGITIEGEGMEHPVWAERAYLGGDYQISHITNNATIFGFGCAAQSPPLGVVGQETCIPEFEDYVTNNDQIVDRDEYIQAMTDMTNYLTDTAWIVPIFAKTEPTVAEKDVTGIAPYRTAYEMDYRHISFTD